MGSPSPVPFPTPLVVKKGSVRAGEGFRVHALARSIDRTDTQNAGRPARGSIGQSPWLRWPMLLLFLFWHRIPGIYHQIEERELELIRIRPYGRQAFWKS